jgi:hypothetical protein
MTKLCQDLANHDPRPTGAPPALRVRCRCMARFDVPDSKASGFTVRCEQCGMLYRFDIDVTEQ